MGPYRRFSGEQRERVAAYHREAFRSGKLVRPSACAACGAKATVGIIDAHNEDYDRPDDFVGLCVRCHLMLHCRYKNRVAWDEYRRLLRHGVVFEPLRSRGFGPITRLLNQLGGPNLSIRLPDTRRHLGYERGPTWLDTIVD